jgi:hypothetical protein
MPQNIHFLGGENCGSGFLFFQLKERKAPRSGRARTVFLVFFEGKRKGMRMWSVLGYLFGSFLFICDCFFVFG